MRLFVGSVKNTNELWDSQTCFCVSLEAGFYHMTPRACSTSMESERFQQLKELTVWFWFSHFQLFSEMSAKPIFAEKEDCKKNWHEIPVDFSIKVKLVFDNCRMTNKQTMWYILRLETMTNCRLLASQWWKGSFLNISTLYLFFRKKCVRNWSGSFAF